MSKTFAGGMRTNTKLTGADTLVNIANAVTPDKRMGSTMHPHQTSGTNISGNLSSKEKELIRHGHHHASNSNLIEESAAAVDRPPRLIEGLTEFLRKEYQRRMGIYLNGGRKEEGLLLNFWKENVSETHKQRHEQEQAELREKKRKENEAYMRKLKRTDPHKYRVILKEREEAQKIKEEKQLKAERIAEKSRHEKEIMEQMQSRNRTMQSKRPQSGAVTGKTGRTSSAVPEIQVKNTVYDEYEKFKDLFPLDVVFTINKDLEEMNTDQVLGELDYVKRRA